MNKFEPSLMDKMFADESAQKGALRRLSLEEVKESVAIDLEALLNTRQVLTPEMLAKAFPECAHSLICYGLRDFSNLSLSSSPDRALICRSLQHAIAQYEPRLKSVRTNLEVDSHNTNNLHFSISAILMIFPAREAVSFDALLHPSTMRYAVNMVRRIAA